MTSPSTQRELGRELTRQAAEQARAPVPPVLQAALRRLPPRAPTACAPSPPRPRLLTPRRLAAALLITGGLAATLLWQSGSLGAWGDDTRVDPSLAAPGSRLADAPRTPAGPTDSSPGEAPGPRVATSASSAGARTRSAAGPLADPTSDTTAGPPAMVRRLFHPSLPDLPAPSLPMERLERMAEGASSRAQAMVDVLAWPLQVITRNVLPR